MLHADSVEVDMLCPKLLEAELVSHNTSKMELQSLELAVTELCCCSSLSVTVNSHRKSSGTTSAVEPLGTWGTRSGAPAGRGAQSGLTLIRTSPRPGGSALDYSSAAQQTCKMPSLITGCPAA